MPSVPTIIRTALGPYLKNKNTGNVYEIATILWVGKRMGLSKAEYAEMKPLIDSIAAYNTKATKKIFDAEKVFVEETTGKGFYLDDKRVVDLRNVTQDDADGGTGDLIAILEDGTEKSISVCEAYGLKSGDLRKCLKNPSCRGFGCGDAEVTKFKALAQNTSAAYEAEMEKKFGIDKALWKRKPSLAAVNTCTVVAADTAAVFNAAPLEKRKALCRNLLSMTATQTKPADYICFVNKNTYKPELYEFGAPVDDFSTVNPTLEAKGIYLYMKLGDRVVAQIQVKFNNGVNSAVHSSWNSVVYLDRVFQMSSASLVASG